MDDILLKLQSQDDEISLSLTIINFVFCILFSLILREFFLRFSNISFNRSSIARNLVILSSIVFVVIVIVKNSLALSLGLVGALSVIRFRTPIKEPEDLAFLFLAIGIGIGYGAGQIYATTIIFLAIISIIWFILSNNSFSVKNDFNFIVETSDENKEKYFEELLEVLKNSTVEASFVKFEQGTNAVIIYYRLVFDDVDNIQKLINDVNRKFSGIKFSLYENKVID